MADGIVFDSKAEMLRYQVLKQLEQDGLIAGLVVHPVFLLQPAFTFSGKNIRKITYEADFEYYERRKHVVEDVKGFATDVFKLKHKMFLFKYPHIEFRIIKA